MISLKCILYILDRICICVLFFSQYGWTNKRYAVIQSMDHFLETQMHFPNAFVLPIATLQPITRISREMFVHVYMKQQWTLPTSIYNIYGIIHVVIKLNELICPLIPLSLRNIIHYVNKMIITFVCLDNTFTQKLVLIL